MPSDLIKIRVRSGNSEAEIEADLSHIREAIGLIPEVVKQLPNGAAGAGVEIPVVRSSFQTTQEERGPGQLPEMNLQQNDSLTEIIGKFFAGSWGAKRRKLSDVREALQSYGLNYPKQSVAVALLRLAKASKIRRFKAEDGEYVYTTSSALLTHQQTFPETETGGNV